MLGEYHYAIQKATERKVLKFVILHDLVNRQRPDDGDELEEDDGQLIEERINAAYKCLDRFYPAVNKQSSLIAEKQNSSEEGVQSGKLCEEACIQYLQNSCEGNQKVLKNVYVNTRRRVTSDKYVPPKIQRKGLVLKDELDGTGIVWTDNTNGDGRHRLCSEFDAVVVSTKKETLDTLDDAQCAFIESIYEAKKTISPSTLHDILSKKLGAVQSLLEDPTAELEYGYGGTVNTIPFASAEERSFVFGIYGSELQQPENASDSIRSIAGSYVVSSNVKEIIRALDRSDVKDDNVMVEVELKSALSIVTSLRSLVEEISHTSKVEVVLILDKTANFLEKKKDD